MAQEVFEAWMPSQHHGEQIPLLAHQFHQTFEFRQRFAVEIMGFKE